MIFQCRRSKVSSHSRIKLMNKNKFTHAVIALFASAAAMTVSHGEILYFDDFSGVGGDLNGTVPDVSMGGASWVAGTRFDDNGIIPAATGNHGAWLPFDPVAGNIYNISADIDTTAGGQNWISLGFSGSATALPNNRAVDVAVVGMGWFLVRENRGSGTGATDAQFFIGEQTQGLTSVPNPPTGVVCTLITLDATDADALNWTMSLAINGAPQTLVFNSMPVDQGDPGADASFGNIHFVGFTLANATVAGTIGNFQVEVIPEPSAALMGGAGLVALLRRRRA